MLVVVASSQDEVAGAAAARWAPGGAALLTCRDLSVAGWRHRPGEAGGATAVVAGRPVATAEIEGVLVRLPYITPYELPHILPADRRYVAEEMTAFLLSWLTELPCPVLNRPTPTCLAGPGWSPEQWVSVASRVGLRVRPLRARIALRPERPRSTVTPSDSTLPALETGPPSPPQGPAAAVTVAVVGRRWFGPAHERLGAGAQRLAAAAGVELLAVHFDGASAGARFVGADLWPDVAQPDVADAVAAVLRRATPA